MHPTKRAFLELHFSVFLYGFTAILGDLISLSAITLVWWRVLITSLSLLFLIRVGQTLKGISKKLLWEYIGIGILIALHWIAFFASIKLANASVALVCFATCSFFTSILEPIFTKSTFKWYELALGALVIPGMILVVQGIQIEMLLGVWIGLISTILIAIFSILNKLRINELDTPSLTFIEMTSAWVFISLILPVYFYYNPEMPFWPIGNDWTYLLILALACTTLGLVLNLRALKHISAFASSLTYNLEPVYGIILAIFILKENKELSPTFYLGVLIILVSVFSYPFIKDKS